MIGSLRSRTAHQFFLQVFYFVLQDNIFLSDLGVFNGQELALDIFVTMQILGERLFKVSFFLNDFRENIFLVVFDLFPSFFQFLVDPMHKIVPVVEVKELQDLLLVL